MISVIVCSIHPDLAQQVCQNIESTIGVPHQILVIDNRNTTDGICKVYNDGASKAQYPYLCFIHEDAIIHTNNWGEKIIASLAQPDIGLVGIAGTVYKSAMPAIWSACNSHLYRGNIIQHFNNGTTSCIEHNPLSELCSEVAVIDGVFIAIAKEKYIEVSFNEAFLKGFHCYDIDLSLRIQLKNYKVVVRQDILLEHFSEGNLTLGWLNQSIIWHTNFKQYLPIGKQKIDAATRHQNDYIAATALLSFLLQQKKQYAKVLEWYLVVLWKFLRINKFRFTKSVIIYFLSGGKGKN